MMTNEIKALLKKAKAQLAEPLHDGIPYKSVVGAFKALRTTVRLLIATVEIAYETIAENAAAPVPMILFCPSCDQRHIDEGDFATISHATHACQHCGVCWRPAAVPTVGVQFLPGFKNEENGHLRPCVDVRCLLGRDHTPPHRDFASTWERNESICNSCSASRFGRCPRHDLRAGKTTRPDLTWTTVGGAQRCESMWKGERCQFDNNHCGSHENGGLKWE